MAPSPRPQFDLFGHLSAAHDPGGRVRIPWRAGSVVTARFSDCDQYRYELAEIWAPDAPLVMWLLMNPSVADVAHADPTLFKTGKFSMSWGFGGQIVANSFAYRATDNARLMAVEDPVGPENDAAICAMAGRAALIVLAYGKPPLPLRWRGPAVTTMLEAAGHGQKLHYLKLSMDGTPQHPLYQRDDTTPRPWASRPAPATPE